MNVIFDIIEDEILKDLEDEVYYPDDITLTLPDEQVRELMKQGLTNSGKKKLGLDTQKVYLSIAGIRVLVQNESYRNADVVDTRH